MKYSRIICEVDNTSCRDIACFDSVMDYINYCSLDFYGITEENDDIDIDDDDECRIFLGRISGYLILCRVMDLLLEDAYTVCDDHSADLEAIMSILTDHDKNYIDDDIFYIKEVTLKDEEFRAVMGKFHYVVLTHYHAFPKIICYYPAPLPYNDEKSPAIKAKEEMAQIITRDIIEQHSAEILGDDNEDEDDSDYYEDENEITIQIHLDEEQQNYILGRRNDYNTYPESAKNLEEFHKFEQAGFKEFRNSRLLVKYI